MTTTATTSRMPSAILLVASTLTTVDALHVTAPPAPPAPPTPSTSFTTPVPECQIAPLYLSRNTSVGIGVTVLGDHLFAIRDAGKLFMNSRAHTDLGNWSIAMGELRDHHVHMIEGFDGPGKMRPTEHPSTALTTGASWRVHTRSALYCDLVWPAAEDVWWPVVSLPFFASSDLRETSLLTAYSRATASGKLDLPPDPRDAGSGEDASDGEGEPFVYDYDEDEDEDYDIEYGACAASLFQDEEDVLEWWRRRRR